MKKFWMVYVEDGYSPQVKHESISAAATEAERLARLSPGKGVHVLESNLMVKATLSIVWGATDSIHPDHNPKTHEKLNANPTVKDQPF